LAIAGGIMASEDQTPSRQSPGQSPEAIARAEHLRDSTKHFVERFAALTGFRVNSTTLGALPREFLTRTVPSPGVLVRQYAYELETRTHNALCRYEPGYDSDPWTYGRLLEIRGFGASSLLDLLEILANHGISST
jgi:hypothetical protein